MREITKDNIVEITAVRIRALAEKAEEANTFLILEPDTVLLLLDALEEKLAAEGAAI